MKITHQNSQEISERISAILNKNINIMNEEGIIVASTDSARIGTLHMGAKKLIEKNDLEIDIYSDEDFSGTRNGINVPIHINGQTIGVIGVTGDPHKLRDIAMIIGEMANIMFMNSQQNMQKEYYARQKRIFSDELLLNPSVVNEPNILERAKILNFPLEKVRAIGVFCISDHVSEDDRLRIDDKLIKMLRSELGDVVYIHHHHVGQNLAVFFNFNINSAAIEHINRILELVLQQDNVNIFCGINFIENFYQINRGYTNAEQALNIAYSTNSKRCLIYEKLTLELLLTNVPKATVEAFMNNVWKTKDESYISNTVDFLNVFFRCSGSLNETAEKLYIHKNTVQYKIKKIYDTTGYDPRITNDAVILNLACRLYEKS